MSSSFPKRLSRYAAVSHQTVKTGLSALTQGKTERAALLRLALGNLKGPLMKIAQILGTIPDLVPPEYTAEFAQLQSDAPPMGWPFVRRRMASELGPQWQQKFRSFAPQASFAASLGQVHKAEDLEGRAVACKLQYPDMASVTEADLEQLKIIFKIFEYFDKAVDTHLVQSEIAERLREELDYTREADHIRMFRTMLAHEKRVHIPTVIDPLSTNRLLTMSWMDGEKFLDAIKTRSQQERNDIAVTLHRAWYAPFYEYGVIHGDPHFGNYTLTPTNDINILDFGCIRVFTPELVGGVVQLYQSLLENDTDKAVEAYRAWGFENPSKELVEILNIWAKFVYAPLLEDSIRPLHETNTGLYGRHTATRVHKELRALGGVTIPRAFVFMDRAAIGLGSVFLRLDARVNWYRLFNEQIGQVDLPSLRQKQSDLLSCAGANKSQPRQPPHK